MDQSLRPVGISKAHLKTSNDSGNSDDSKFLKDSSWVPRDSCG